MSNTFLPLFKTNLKIAFDFRGKRQKASMLSILIFVSILGMFASGVYSFIFVMAASETNTDIINVLFAMSGFASLLALTTTIPKVKTTLFGGNDYDMLAAMPIPKREILFVKFFSLYLVELFYTFIILLPAGIICFIFDNNVMYLVHTFLMLFLVPVFPLLLACLIGTFISVIADRSKFGNFITIVFYIIFIVLIMGVSMMTSSEEVADLDPMFNMFKWFNPTNVLLSIDIPVINYLLYVIVNVIILIGVIGLLTFFYDYIHDLLSTARKTKRKTPQKDVLVNTPSKSLLKIEFKRYFSSKGYLLNTIIGGVMSVILITMAVIGISGEDMKPEDLEIIKMFIPYLSIAIMWFVGMSTPAASAISIEGKNFWLIKSLPIDYKKYLRTKILLSEFVLAPFALVSSIILILVGEKNMVSILLILLLPQLYLLSMNYISLVLNTRFYKFSWSNEMEVVKQSKCVFFVMLIDFVYTLIIAVLLLGLGLGLGLWVGAIASISFALIITLISRTVLYKKGPKRIANMEL